MIDADGMMCERWTTKFWRAKLDRAVSHDKTAAGLQEETRLKLTDRRTTAPAPKCLLTVCAIPGRHSISNVP